MNSILSDCMSIDVDNNTELFTIKQASDWASRHLGKNVTTSNIGSVLTYDT